MAVKTITVRKEAYEALKAMKVPDESFSETILRITKRKPLSYFYGALSKKAGEALEKNISEMRKSSSKLDKERMKRILKELKE